MVATTRLAEPERDFPRIADLLTQTSLDPVTADELHEDEARRVPGKLRQRLVAVNGEEHVVGHAWTVHYPSQSAGRFHLFVVVDPAYRRQGIGSQLYDQTVQFAHSHGATVLVTEVMEREAEGLTFAEKRGFTVSGHSIAATLDLATFDESCFEGLVESLEAAGLRFFSFAQAGNTPESQRRLYEINRIGVMDDPAAVERTFPSFEVWRGLIPGSAGFDPEGQLLAADGESYVGLSAIALNPETGTAHTLITGVHPAYRGRKIALALKLLAVRFAQARGATRIVTETDARNAAMMAINRRLAFQPEPGYYSLTKRLT